MHTSHLLMLLSCYLPVQPSQEAIETAIREIRSPLGMRQVKVSAKSTNRSATYDASVGFKVDVDEPDAKNMSYCVASMVRRHESRKALASRGLLCKTTDNSTRHLTDVYSACTSDGMKLAVHPFIVLQ